MAQRLLRILPAVAVVVPVLLYAPEARPASAQSGCQMFTETGKTVCGAFLAYWSDHGGLAQQGYPVSSSFSELSEVNGRAYTVQYFERAVFEHHPENRPPYDVLLSLLGSIAYRQKYPTGVRELPDNSAPSRFFPETGKDVRGAFLDYWQGHGGLAQQGYPISNRFVERSDLDGKEYVVQYFERAVFELHPENRAPYDVLLSQLGALKLRQRYPNGVPGTATPIPTQSADEWAALRQRPLRLPAVEPGGPCPTAPGGRQVASEFGLALGDGPLYPAGFDERGVYDYTGAIQEGGWYLLKVLWIGDPSYKGAALVRGRQVDGPGELRFNEGANPSSELRLHTDAGNPTASGWNNWPSYTRLRGPGCYAYQVDGLGFSDVVVFRAITSSR
jgi:hypothetical protein